MKSNREEAISETLKWEGGYSNHPKDPGGPTNWGITIQDAKKYWKKNATAKDVKAMPKSVAVEIYRQKYWKTPYYDCDTLASGVDLAVFDFGVNSGPARAKKYLDKSVGGSAHDTINKIFDQRMAFLRGLSTWSTFGPGWTNRCNGVRKKSHQLADKNPSTAAVVTATIAAATTGTAVASPADWLPIIIVGGLVAAIVLYAGIRLYRKWKKNV